MAAMKAPSGSGGKYTKWGWLSQWYESPFILVTKAPYIEPQSSKQSVEAPVRVSLANKTADT
jgi:hypothetical protein